MNSDQLTSILRGALGSKFKGVYAADATLPQATSYPYGFVVNTDPSSKPGKHWQAIWCVNNAEAEFFDSFGDPTMRDNIKNYLSKYKKIEKNLKKIQKNYETSCGPHVVYFLLKRNLGVSFRNIINSLENRQFADVFVKFFVSNLIINGPI